MSILGTELNMLFTINENSKSTIALNCETLESTVLS